MKQKVKVVVAFLLVLILAMSAFGCNKVKEVDGVLAEGYVAKVEGKVKVNYYAAQTETEKRSVRDWVAAFEKKYPKCKVDTETTFLTDMQRIDAQISSGTVGDVVFFTDVNLYNYAAIQKVLMPLDYYIDEYDIDTGNIFGAILEMGKVEGKTYMAMRDYNHIVLTYNKDAVRAAGLQDPVELDNAGQWTWDTFKTYCSKLTKKDGNETTQVGAYLRLGYAPNYIPFLEGFGGEWYNTVNKKITFTADGQDINSSLVTKGILEMINFVDSGNVKYVRSGGNTNTGKELTEITTGANAHAAITPEDAVFMDIQFPLLVERKNAYEQKSIDWDIVSFPALPTPRVGTGATGFAVFNQTRNPDAAAALCLSLYTEEGQRAYHGSTGGSVPNVRTLADDTFWRVGGGKDNSIDTENGKNYNAFISHPEADTYGQPRSVLPPDIADIVNDYMENLIPDHFNGVKQWQDTVAELQKTANDKWIAIMNEQSK